MSGNSEAYGAPEVSLDPDDWESFRALAHSALDDAIEFLRTARERPVWRPAPERVRNALDAPASTAGQDLESVYQEFKDLILPSAPAS